MARRDNNFEDSRQNRRSFSNLVLRLCLLHVHPEEIAMPESPHTISSRLGHGSGWGRREGLMTWGASLPFEVIRYDLDPGSLTRGREHWAMATLTTGGGSLDRCWKAEQNDDSREEKRKEWKIGVRWTGLRPGQTMFEYVSIRDTARSSEVKSRRAAAHQCDQQQSWPWT